MTLKLSMLMFVCGFLLLAGSVHLFNLSDANCGINLAPSAPGANYAVNFALACLMSIVGVIAGAIAIRANRPVERPYPTTT